MTLFTLLGLCLCCFLCLEFPFLLIFYLVKLLISSRSRSHASPSVKTFLHIYDTFLRNFSCWAWLYTFPVCSTMHALMYMLLLYNACLLFTFVPPSRVSDKMLNDRNTDRALYTINTPIFVKWRILFKLLFIYEFQWEAYLQKVAFSYLCWSNFSTPRSVDCVEYSLNNLVPKRK